MLAFTAVAGGGVLLWVWNRAEAPRPGVVLSARIPADAVDQTPGGPPARSRAPATPDSRFQLLRVVTPPGAVDGHGSEALISIDGLPPKSYRVGDRVVGAVIVQSLQPDRAVLGPVGGEAVVVLDAGSPAPTSPLPGREQPTTAGATDLPAPRPESAAPVDRSPVPVTDPDHGADTSNH